MNIKEVVSNNIKEMRVSAGYTQEAISSYLGISQPAYAKYENAETVVSVDTIQKLATLYGIDEYDFYEENPVIRETNLAFAFRANEISPKDLVQIAKFKKIVRNYLTMSDELNQIQTI